MVAAVQPNQRTESGTIAKVIYSREDTGYCVLSVEADDFESYTAVGVMPDAAEGVRVDLQGEWKTHPKFGKQFAFFGYCVPQPTTEEGSISFLATLKGVGPSLAKEMYRTFGNDIFGLLDESSDRIRGIKGIGPKNFASITSSYQKTKGLRDLIGFLASVGVSATYANRIYKVYGTAAIGEIKKNPYILAEEVRGFGFLKADEVARAMGIAPNSRDRIIAAIMHVLKQAASFGGHCYLNFNECCTEACSALVLPEYRPQISDVAEVIETLRSSRANKKQRLIVEDERCFLEAYHRAEEHFAIGIHQLSGSIQLEVEQFDVNAWVEEYQEREGIQLSAGQKIAVKIANLSGVMVLTGGPGTGKSSVSRAIVQSWQERNKRVIGCTPTGRAGQRLKECTGLSNVSTIHRLLGWNGHGFERDINNPIDADAFIIDEFSMVDIKLAAALFDAIPPHAVVAIVGDADQLPSVGAGNVLSDLIQSDVVPVVHFPEVFRQAATSPIIPVANAINKGEVPYIEQTSRSTGEPRSDMLLVRTNQENLLSGIEWLLMEKLPSMGWAQDDIQVMSPMNRGKYGNEVINAMIQGLWNPRGVKIPGLEFRVGDRVIQTRNDYDKGIFNGDIGKIEGIDHAEKEAYVWFPDISNPEGKHVTLDWSDMDDLTLAYGITIHKAQGSEFPVVVIPCAMSHFIMLQRNLYYTGVTRGKKLVVLVGEEKAIAIAIKNHKPNQRNTMLVERLGG